MKYITPRISWMAGLLVVLFAFPGVSLAQSGASEVLDTASLEQQLDYLVDRTRVYDNYRAVRDDIFLKMRKNALDSLNNVKLDIARLNSVIQGKDFEIESLNSDLERTKKERDAAIHTKDSFAFLGLEIQKGIYNTIMWILVLAFLGAGIILFLFFKRSYAVTSATKKELEQVQNTFEEYRKSSREKYEKLVVSHHNEIMKLKRP